MVTERAVIVNGELSSNPSFLKRIRGFNGLIAVDGGLKHCNKYDFNPKAYIGDNDSSGSSVEAIIAKYPGISVDILDRDKDLTDLEAALKKCAGIDKVQRVFVFAGLGGRVDHSLMNILLLLKYPCKLFLETAMEKLFALNPQVKDFELECSSDQELTFIPLYGRAEGIRIQVENQPPFDCDIDREKLVYEVGLKGNKFKVSVKKGEVICILSKRSEKNNEKRDALENITEPTEIYTTFGIQRPFKESLKIIRRLCQNPHQLSIDTDRELVFALNKSSVDWCIPEKHRNLIEEGRTVSFIPFNGPATLIIDGFGWEGNPNKNNQLTLTKDLISISNIVMKPNFTIKVISGTVLFIINKGKELVDKEMYKKLIAKK